MNKNNLLILAIGFILFSGCSKSNLDVPRSEKTNMDNLFSLLEQLVVQTAPSVTIIQSILSVHLVQISNTNKYWQFYEAHPTTGTIARVDYRLPLPDATKTEPFLVLDLRDMTFHLSDIEKRYGEVQMNDISAHHPHFIGWSFDVNGRLVSATVDSKTKVVLSIVVDFSKPLK